jgi:glutathione synthase/RimK-type ligase-like ATP-grasp enzyme
LPGRHGFFWHDDTFIAPTADPLGPSMRVAILTPAPDYWEDWAWAYDVEAAALARAGFEVEPLAWTSAGDLAGFEAVLPLVVWGYHCRIEEWLALLERVEANGAPPMINPAALLRWNSDKAYLEELAAKGVPTVASRTVESLDEESLDGARVSFGEHLVIKPLVSAAADDTFRIGPGDGVPNCVRGRRMLVQPFMPAISTVGEYSLMLFGGEFSHAIVKRPKAGDFRVQPHLGGSETPCAPPDGAIDLARAALAAAPAAATYARVDMIEDPSGELLIMELELIEPALWLQHSPDGGTAFARAIRSAVERA